MAQRQTEPLLGSFSCLIIILKAQEREKITCRKGGRDGDRAPEGLPHHHQHHHHDQPPHLDPLQLTPSSPQFHFFQHHLSFSLELGQISLQNQSLVTLVKSEEILAQSSSQLEVPASTEVWTITQQRRRYGGPAEVVCSRTDRLVRRRRSSPPPE